MPESTSHSIDGVENPILVATDFSPDSDAALKWACQYAAIVKAPIHLLHVIHDPADASGFYRRDEDDSSEPLAGVAERMLADYTERMKSENPDLECLQSATTELVNGLPPGRIVETAEHCKAQLVVVGSRGLTGLAHVLVGSVAERVAQLASMPVVIVKRSGGN